MAKFIEVHRISPMNNKFKNKEYIRVKYILRFGETNMVGANSFICFSGYGSEPIYVIETVEEILSMLKGE